MIRVVWLALILVMTCGIASAETHSASYIPWSGYWWPFVNGGLVTGNGYKGNPSPLAKYDYVTSGTYYGPVSSYGSKYYNPSARSWEGMCFGWSMAAILESEPRHKGYYNGTLFRVGDKKGLLTAKYDGAIYNTYPINSPLDFHQLLERFIRDEQTPVIIDLGTDGEIWNYPVYKYTTDYTTAGVVRHYTTTISFASDGVFPDYVGTATLEETYYYYIKTDPFGEEILESGWEGTSIDEPPVNGFEPLGTACRIPDLDLEVLDSIAGADDDGYENNDNMDAAALVSNGSYSLIAADQDWFRVPMKTGDLLKISLDYQDEEGALDITCSRDTNEVIFSNTDSGTYEIIALQDGDYYLQITPYDTSNEEEYTLNLKQTLSQQGVFPVNPAGSWVNGISLLDAIGSPNRRLVTLMDKNGFAFQGTEFLNDDPYRVGGLENSYGLGSTGSGYILVDSDMPVLGVHAIAAPGGLLMGSNLLSTENAAESLYYPYTPKVGNIQTWIGFINVGDETEIVVREAYDSNGNLIMSDEITLGPGAKFEQDTFYIGIISSNTKSLKIYTKSGRDTLIGYYRLHNTAYDQKGWAVIPLQQPSSSEICVPQVASNNLWETRFHLMNTGITDSVIMATAFDEGGNYLTENVLVLYGMQQTSISTPELFPGISSEDIASVRLKTSNGDPVSGMVMYERKNQSQFTGIPFQTELRSEWTLPHLAFSGTWTTCLGLMNAGGLDSDTSFRLYDARGDLIATEKRYLDTNQQSAVNLIRMFSKDLLQSAAYMKITSENDQPLVGIFFYATTDGMQLTGGTLQ